MNQEIFNEIDFTTEEPTLPNEFLWDAMEKLIKNGYVIDSFSYLDALKDYVIVAHKTKEL